MEPQQSSISVGELEFTTIEAGPPDGETVMCLHGFPDAPSSFRHQVPALVDAGYRVIVPTLRGYEPPSQPADGDYSLMALVGDVIGWLDARGLDRAHVVGHDWGAVIGYVAAANHPDRFHTLTTLAIPPLARIPDAVRRVPRQLQRSWYGTFFLLRGVSDRVLAANDWWLMRRLWATWSPGYELADDEWVALRRQFEAPGVVPASLAYYRQNAKPSEALGLKPSPALEKTVIDVPTLVMHGALDGCMDRRLFAHAVLVDDFPAGVRVQELPDAGHFLHLERPEAVNDHLLGHLATPPPR